MIPSLRRQPFLQTVRFFSEWSHAQILPALLGCLRAEAGFHLQKGLPSLAIAHLTGQAGTERKNQSPVPVGVGIPRKMEPVTSSFTADCTPTPSGLELFIASHPKHRLLFWVLHAWPKAQL